jgi:GxxExxY protein
MPIEISTETEVGDQEEFHALDRRVMRVVFDMHNEFGRLLDEELYKREIAIRCAEGGIQMQREVRIRLTHEVFVKDYFMDMLVCRAFMLEAKVVECLAPTHRAQALNYLLLAGLRHGRLVNLRTERVQHEFVSTTLTPEERRRFRVVESDWREVDEQSRLLKDRTLELVQDWGAFLDVNLYREALIYLLGGFAAVCRPVPIFSGSRCVGTQNLNLLNEDIAFVLTTRQELVEATKDHLQRLLRHTSLKFIQWVNLNRHVMELRTIQR